MRKITLKKRPAGIPLDSDFEIVEEALPDLADGEVRVENEFISVDPYLRGRMDDVPSYLPPFQIGDVIANGAVGRVTESRSADLPVGVTVQHQGGWTTHAQGKAELFRQVPELPDGAPNSLYLGLLGMPGVTAYAGLTRVAKLKEGESVFISGAAGAVGTAAGQIARRLGASVIVGSVGSSEKAKLITEKYGFDAAVNYKESPIREQLPGVVREAGVESIDVYYDNVGGDHLEAAIDVMSRKGRAALCGVIAQMNEVGETPGPRNMAEIIKKSLTLQGFTFANYPDAQKEYLEKATQWLAEGTLHWDETVVEGFDSTLDAFRGLFEGSNTGKMVVKL